jgi:hypothetical protein
MACSEFRVYAVFTRLKAELQTASVMFAHDFKMDGVLARQRYFRQKPALSTKKCGWPSLF